MTVPDHARCIDRQRVLHEMMGTHWLAYTSKQDTGGGIHLLHSKLIQQAHADVVVLVHAGHRHPKCHLGLYKPVQASEGSSHICAHSDSQQVKDQPAVVCLQLSNVAGQRSGQQAIFAREQLSQQLRLL